MRMWTTIRERLGLGLVMAAGMFACASADGQTLRTQLVASGLSQPVGVYAPPGNTGRLFVVEQVGRIRIIDLTTTPPTLSGTAFLDISQTAANVADRLTVVNGERGLLGLAFDPNFATNGRFYVNYTTTGTAPNFFTRIDRFTVTGTPATATAADTSTRITLLTFQQDFDNHNGGSLAFGPDGMLYVGAGDGGSGNDPNNRAVNLDVLLGKILRLDPNDVSNTDGDGLFVPDDNPFRAAGGAVRPYIWAYGVRNPWRMTFDRQTGDLWIADVGQDSREEINFQPRYIPGGGGNFAQVAGRHYGWDCREGFISLGGLSGGRGCDGAAVGVYTDPVKDYTHGAPDNACSVTGGHVYRGSAIPALQGAYMVADYCGNWVRSFRYSASNPTVTDIRDWTTDLGTGTGAVNGIVAINEDAAGELYIVSINLGSVYKIVTLQTSTCGAACPAPVNALATVFFDNFETNQGWTTALGAGATDGAWERGVPVATLNGYLYNPPFASGGSGNAFVTENSDPPASTTNSDVDGGSVLLTSPAINGSRGQLTLCFDYYLAMTEIGGANPDGLFVEVSGNGLTGPFTRILSASITTLPVGGCVWTTQTVTTSQLASAGITNQSDIRIRFVASDNASPSQTIVEAGVDNVRVQTGNPPPDCNGNGIADATDIANATSADCNGNGVPDECDIAASITAANTAGNQNLRIDLDGGPVGVIATGGTFFGSSCAGCHAAMGTGATGPNIRNKDRVTIRNRIVFNIPALHPGGNFPSLVAQDFANIEAFLADFGSKGRPDGIIDTCQTLTDCDHDGVSDGRELQLATQADLDYDGVPDTCECPCDINGANGITVQDIFDFLSLWFANSPQADFNLINGVTVQDIFDFLACWFMGC